MYQPFKECRGVVGWYSCIKNPETTGRKWPPQPSPASGLPLQTHPSTERQPLCDLVHKGISNQMRPDMSIGQESSPPYAGIEGIFLSSWAAIALWDSQSFWILALPRTTVKETKLYHAELGLAA